MKLSYVAILALFSGYGTAQFTWPSAYDELEDVMFLNTGYKSRGFSSFITPCSFSANGPGRQTAAEWLRAGFHDMATTNVFFAPHGGIDASLAFELNDGENIGAGFNSTFLTYAGFFNSRLPVADLVALGVYASVRSCGGPVVPMRGGRVDATAAGPLGVPQPQNGAGTFSNQFARMGFNTTDMIQMTACGHTLGGVHAGDFPQIVVAGTAPDDFQLFDNTEGWDNAIATRYVNGPDTDPLAVGISVSSGRNSDFAVFNSDKNVTITSMTNADSFNAQCASILQRMIEVVDPTIVTLSSIIQPYEVKPSGLQLTLLSGGTQLQFAGDIRVRTTTRSAASITGVQLVYTDINGAAGGTINAATVGTANGFDDIFTFYSFSSNLPIATSISSFNVVITSNGLTQTYNNGGNGFPVSDSVIVQTSESCITSGNLNVVAAVRSTVTTPVNFTITQKVSRNAGSPIPSPLPSLVSTSVTMVKGAAIGPYNLYSGSAAISSITGAKYRVTSGSFSDNFKDPADLGTVCASAPPTASSSSSTSASSTKTSTSTSSSATPTLAHKPTVGAYSFQGCYTEGDGVRALSGGSFYDYTGMTLEQCAADCTGFSYWGVEYGGECYCGNTLAASSTLATLSDCSFTCPGNAYEYCGAGNRLEMYLLTSLASSSSSSSVASSTTGVSSSSSSSSSSKSSVSSTSTVASSTSKSSSVSSSVSSSKSSSSSSVVSTSSSSSATATLTLAIKQTVGAYSFQGCYTEATDGRALSGASYYDYDAMTLEACASDCAGWAYFGVEYGGECYCGTSPNAGSVSTTLSDCSFTCPGNPYEYCGAGNRLEMYMLSSLASSSSSSSSGSVKSSSTSSKSTTSTSKSVTATSSTSTKPSSTSSKSSSSSSSKSSSSSTTTKTSTTSSSTSKSSTSTSTTTKSTTSTTTTTTTSKSTLSSTTKSSTTASTPTQTAPAIKSHIGNYTYYGCQTEATNVRALSSDVSYNYTSMTLEMCSTSCNGYTYWGVEYGGECYCGNSFGAGSVNATETDCSFTCPGDALEWCGAGNRLSTYYLTG